MKLNLKKMLFGDTEPKRPVLLEVTPPRTGERTLLGVENLLGSIAVPEPFSLELAGSAYGVALMARCIDDRVVRGQIAVRYPQARIVEVSPEDDPLRLGEGEEAWGMNLRSSGPEYVPLRTFRDDDLLDPGSDPMMALLAALSELQEGERIVARLKLNSLGPDWSQGYMEKAHRNPAPQTSESAQQTGLLQMDGITMAVLGIGTLIAIRGYLWVQSGEIWKAVLLGAGSALGLAVGGWIWHRWRKARNRIHDPLLIREKVARMAFDAEVQVTAILPRGARSPEGQAPAGPGGGGIPPLRQPGGSTVQGGKDATPGSQPGGPASLGPRLLRRPQCHWREGGGRPVAPAGSKGRDPSGGPFRGEDAAAHGWQGEWRRPRRRHHLRYAKKDSLPR